MRSRGCLPSTVLKTKLWSIHMFAWSLRMAAYSTNLGFHRLAQLGEFATQIPGMLLVFRSTFWARSLILFASGSWLPRWKQLAVYLNIQIRWTLSFIRAGRNWAVWTGERWGCREGLGAYALFTCPVTLVQVCVCLLRIISHYISSWRDTLHIVDFMHTFAANLLSISDIKTKLFPVLLVAVSFMGMRARDISFSFSWPPSWQRT